MMGHDGMGIGNKGDGRMRVKPWMIWHGMCTLNLASASLSALALAFAAAFSASTLGDKGRGVRVTMDKVPWGIRLVCNGD